MKLECSAAATPFESGIYEVEEFTTNFDVALFERDEIDDFITMALNPHYGEYGGIDVDEEDIAYIESFYLPGVIRLK
jgi:hypothetical protein